ncbi:hypothetical protein PGQ11_008128 [Apiospora arundinis]|uniref:Uncharacterized protein n=1 Tax=Apiospora arundinis TaxID=335852 RepID=A0ABR2IFP9_9PEZI
MATSESGIPWDLLTSNFSFASSYPDHENVTDFFQRKRPDQGRDLNKFVEFLSEILAGSAARERQKFPDRYEAAARDEVVITESDALKIAPHMRRHHLKYSMDERHYEKQGCPVSLCTHVGDTECLCALRFEERRMSSFLHRFSGGYECYAFDRTDRDSFLGQELLKTILVYGDMDTVLRICAHPDVDFLTWWNACQCQCIQPDLGWDLLIQDALPAYIGLRFIQSFSNIWERGPGDVGPRPDFRQTRMYQGMVRNSTMSGYKSGIPSYLHKKFFGIQDGQFNNYPELRDKDRWRVDQVRGHSGYQLILGRVPYDEFLEVEKEVPYMPSSEEVEEVRSALFAQGLPAELTDIILELAEYHGERRALEVPHDPFHEKNREQLDRYLRECWKVLMRCDMMARALGDKVPWDVLIGRHIFELFRDLEGSTKLSSEYESDADEPVVDDWQTIRKRAWERGDRLRFDEYYKTVFL